MCRVCKIVESMSLGDALNTIGEALADPTFNRSHLDELTARLMDEGRPQEDDEKALEYYRRLQGDE